MAGLNHVRSGGNPLTLTLSDQVTLSKVSVGPMDNNAYLLQTPAGSVLIDAAHSAKKLMLVVGGDLVHTIVTTHRHGDHWQALSAVAAQTGAQLTAGRPDVEAIEEGAGVSSVTGVWDGDRVRLDVDSLEVIGIVGHTPGSIVLAYTDGAVTHLFTGDSLFPGGPGRTATPGDFVSLMNDLEAKIFARFDDDTVVHPGHGDDTTLGAERPHLAEWRARGW
jgi:glyoxylase-like metal-dependent hydrolase (beta-lactamase superfamily II)